MTWEPSDELIDIAAEDFDEACDNKQCGLSLSFKQERRLAKLALKAAVESGALVPRERLDWEMGRLRIIESIYDGSGYSTRDLDDYERTRPSD